VKLIAYVDESGLPIRCSTFVVAAVWKAVPPSVSYYQLGAAALLRAARELGMERARELKYTAARRRGWEAVGRVVEEIAREFRVDYEVLHAEGPRTGCARSSRWLRGWWSKRAAPKSASS